MTTMPAYELPMITKEETKGAVLFLTFSLTVFSCILILPFKPGSWVLPS